MEFLDSGECIHFEAVDAWLPKLHAILSWFEHQTSFHFYSSSVLLIYDAKSSRNVPPLLLLLLLHFIAQRQAFINMHVMVHMWGMFARS